MKTTNINKLTSSRNSLKETGFHTRTAAITNHFVEHAGYSLPARYSDNFTAEYWACRRNTTVMDLSSLRKFEILGPDAETLLQYCLPRSINRVSVGQVIYSPLCNELGGMVGDGTLFRLGLDNFRWVGVTDFDGEWLEHHAKKLNLKVYVRPSSGVLDNISIQGPKSRDALRNIIWTSPTQPTLDELRWYRFAIARLHNFDGVPIILSRTGYTGELGFEIWCHRNHAIDVWDSVLDSGANLGITPMGLEALDCLRIEAGFISPGHEYNDQTNPYEAGINPAILHRPKNEHFIGKQVLDEKSQSQPRQLVGLVLSPDSVAKHGDLIHVKNNCIGEVTSTTYSPTLERNIALAKISRQSKPSDEVTVGDSLAQGRVVRLPFHDPQNLRIRA